MLERHVIVGNMGDSLLIEDPLWVTVLTKFIAFIWLLTCIIPNSIIIRRVGNSEVYQTKNFYFILVHLSWGNLLQMIYFVYRLFITEEYQSDPKIFMLLVFHISTTQTHIQHALFLSIDKYVNSKKFCRNNIKNNWTLHAVGLLIITILMMHDIIALNHFFIGFITFLSIIICAYITRVVFYLIKGTTEENYKIRLAISGICLFSNYLYVVWIILEYLVEIDDTIAFTCASFMVHTTGWFNLLLLKYYDPNVDVRLNFKKNCGEIKGKFKKCFSKGKKAPPPELERYESNTSEGVILNVDHSSSSTGNLPPIYTPNLTRQTVSEMFEPNISQDNVVFAGDDYCTVRNQSPLFNPRVRQEHSISII